jgi:hypothetical protein
MARVIYVTSAWPKTYRINILRFGPSPVENILGSTWPIFLDQKNGPNMIRSIAFLISLDSNCLIKRKAYCKYGAK